MIHRQHEYKQVPKALLEKIDAVLRNGENRIIAIEGRCGSGKSTVAAALKNIYGCSVVRMDHFFLRPEQRTKERLAIPGENIDHERFLNEVLLKIKAGESFSYRPFDCSSQSLADPVWIASNGLTVVEGTYSCHKELWEYYDLRIFLTVEPEEQMRRIVARNGDYAAVFRERWIPMEEAYFDQCDIQSRCDLCLHTDP